jgi:hypothetical protein
LKLESVMVISGFTSTIRSIIRQGSRFGIMQKLFTRSELQATVGALVQRALDVRSRAADVIGAVLEMRGVHRVGDQGADVDVRLLRQRGSPQGEQLSP